MTGFWKKLVLSQTWPLLSRRGPRCQDARLSQQLNRPKNDKMEFFKFLQKKVSRPDKKVPVHFCQLPKIFLFFKNGKYLCQKKDIWPPNVGGRGPSLYYVSTFFDFFRPLPYYVSINTLVNVRKNLHFFWTLPPSQKDSGMQRIYLLITYFC